MSNRTPSSAQPLNAAPIPVRCITKTHVNFEHFFHTKCPRTSRTCPRTSPILSTCLYLFYTCQSFWFSDQSSTYPNAASIFDPDPLFSCAYFSHDLLYPSFARAASATSSAVPSSPFFSLIFSVTSHRSSKHICRTGSFASNSWDKHSLIASAVLTFPHSGFLRISPKACCRPIEPIICIWLIGMLLTVCRHITNQITARSAALMSSGW